MKSITYIALLACVGLLPALPANAKEMTAYQIMKQVDERYNGDTSVADSSMILIDARDRQRVRDLKVYTKDYGDNSKGISFFQSPADIKGTAYLNYDWDAEGKEDDSWLYLPALQKVKRIAAGDKSDPFLGSDFSYADINGLELDWYNYTIINNSDPVDGSDCWVIEVVPKAEFKDKSEETTGYEKSQTWIRKDNFMSVRGKIWVKRGNKVKYFSASDIRQIDGVWTAMKLQMITTKNDKRQHASVFQLHDITYNQPLGDELFSTEAMQRGI